MAAGAQVRCGRHPRRVGRERCDYDYCTSAFFLDQAGVTSEFVYLSTVGIRGNGHMLMLEKKNLESADFLRDRLESELR